MGPDWIAASITFIPSRRLSRIITGGLISAISDGFRFRDGGPVFLTAVCQKLSRIAYAGHRLYDSAQPVYPVSVTPRPCIPLSATIGERLGEARCEQIRLFFQ